MDNEEEEIESPKKIIDNFGITLPTDSTGEINHLKYSNFLTFLSLSNLNDLFLLGSKRALQQEDLGLLHKKDRVAEVLDRFNKLKNPETAGESTTIGSSKQTLFQVLLKTTGWNSIALGLILQAVAAGITLI